MIDCCVAKLEEMHKVANYFWWFQQFIMASPFILIIPDLDPTSGTNDLLQTGLQKSGEMAYSMASNVVYKNKQLPDFVDAVKAIGKISYDQLRTAAFSHGTLHITKDRDIANFWFNMSQAYNDAFNGK
jgi:hypothetical protein